MSHTVSLLDLVRQWSYLTAKAFRAMKTFHYISPFRKKMSLGKTFSKSANKNPDNIFIYYEDRRITYKECNETANRLAHCLLQEGLKKGDVVALFMENRPEYLICAIAMAKIGVPVALINSSQTHKVLVHSINLVKPTAVIIGEELIDTYNEVREDILVDSDKVYSISDNDTLNEASKEFKGFRDIMGLASQCAKSNPKQTQTIVKDDDCFYIYTSGTTGLPKASVTKHQRWIMSVGAFGHFTTQLKSDDVMYCPLPFYHATAMVVCLGAIVSGCSGLAMRRKFSVTSFWDDIDRYQATAFGYVGELCRYLLNQAEKADDAKHGIRIILGNGLRPALWDKFQDRFNIPVIMEFYASSEGNAFLINLFNLRKTIGFALSKVATVKCNEETGQPILDEKGRLTKVPKGQPGLMVSKISNSRPFVGYTQKDKTKKAIINNAFKNGDAWYNTGDLLINIGWNHFQFCDRLGDTFRWKGENVSTTEVENILGEFTAIAEAVVFGVEVPGNEGRAGMASIVVKPGLTLNVDALSDYMTTQLPSYAVPVFLRTSEATDITGTFKPVKSRLKQEAYDPRKLKENERLYAKLQGMQSFEELSVEQYEQIRSAD